MSGTRRSRQELCPGSGWSGGHEGDQSGGARQENGRSGRSEVRAEDTEDGTPPSGDGLVDRRERSDRSGRVRADGDSRLSEASRTRRLQRNEAGRHGACDRVCQPERSCAGEPAKRSGKRSGGRSGRRRRTGASSEGGEERASGRIRGRAEPKDAEVGATSLLPR